jgi:hypothetical protein
MRQFSRADIGGYGMMDMRIMNECFKSVWIRRIKEMKREPDYMAAVTLGTDGMTEGMFDYERVGNRTMAITPGPIILDIIENWRRFKFEYYRVGHNVLGALLFGNVGIDRDNRSMETVIFGGRYGEVRDRIGGIVVGDLVDERRLVKEKGEIENRLEIRMTWAEYFRLRTVVRTIVDLRDVTDDGIIQLSEFMNKGKVRSKRLRMIYDGKRGRKYKDNNPNTIASLRTLWGARIDQKERKYIEWNLRLWTISVLEAKFKDFSFKLLHGRLYLNLALSHFSDTKPGCTFCRIRKKVELVGRGIDVGTMQFRIEMDQIQWAQID